MKVLVTGGMGFTGKALVRRMIDEGHQVVALDNKEGYKTSEMRDWGANWCSGRSRTRPPSSVACAASRSCTTSPRHSAN